MDKAEIKNWDGTQSWRPEAIHYPEDDEQIARLILRAREDKKRIKAVGSALSWSDIIDIPSVAIRFSRMNRVIEVDRDGRRIRLQPGARLIHVNDILARNGLAFDNFGSIIIQTAAGYIGTGTHGTGGKTPILSTAIERLRMVDGRGQILELDAEKDPALFSAARVNLGCLGVVTEIVFKCVDAFDLEERLELVDFDTALSDLASHVADNDYCKFWWLPYTDQIQVYTFNRTDRPRGGFGLTGMMDRTGLSGVFFTGLIKLGHVLPGAIPFLDKTVQKIHFHPRRRVDRSDRVIKVSNSIPIHQETEYAFPVERAAEAIDEMRNIVLNADYRVNFPMEVRFVAADDIPMSPATGRNSCYIGAYVSSLKWAPPYFADFQELMRDYSGRPHWGKSFSRTPGELKALYPSYDAFDRIRRRCDPDGLFRNRFTDRVFETD